MVNKHYYIVLILFTFCYNFVSGYSKVSVNKDIQKYNAAKQMYYYVDSTGNLTVDDILKINENFIQHTEENVNFGYSKYPYWVRITVSNENNIRPLYLEFNYPHLDSIDFYFFENEKLVYKQYGRMYPFNNRDIKNKNFIIPIKIDTGKTQTYYVRFSGDCSRQFPPIIRTEESLIYKEETENMLYGLYYGIMLAMLLYNFFLYLSIRDKSYLMYSIYIFSYILVQFTYNGFAYKYLWPNMPYWNQISIPLLISTCMIGIGIFTKIFLNVKQNAPKYVSLIWGMIVIGVIIVIIALLGLYQIAIKLALFYMLITAAVAMLSGISAYRNGYKPARFFVIAWISLLTGLVMLSLKSLTILPNIFITEFGVQIGSAIEVILLSFALADKINVIKAEKDKAQQNLIIQYRKNAELDGKYKAELELQVRERTKEIETQKEEIETQRDEIELKNDKLERKQFVLEQALIKVEEKNNQLEEINNEITDSIKYAKRIQRALLFSIKHMQNIFKDYFILNLPKDIVSGDFYWAMKKNKWALFTVADCTGHGVPGAFMSMLGISMLNEIANDPNVLTSSEVLNKLRAKTISSLHQTGKMGENKDGMDMAFCAYNIETSVLQYAGANNPIYIIRKNNLPPVVSDKQTKPNKINENSKISLFEIKPDKMPIAIHDKMNNFENHCIQIYQDDIVYLFSDGYVDQFGGHTKNGKKFKHLKLKKTILEIAHLPLIEQKQVLKQTFLNWKGIHPQVDDILFIGVKF